MVRTLTLVVNGNTYSNVEEKLFKNCINLAKKKYKQEGKYAIVAVQKDDFAEMKDETFLDNKAMSKKIMEYNKNGFLVFVQRPIGPKKYRK
ncbi:MAG: hypothetical protein N3B21_19460 [Clostridia bacterium]|nr:hypothetical protein [Clostridia bacterium]